MKLTADVTWISPNSGPMENYDRGSVTKDQLKEIEDLTEKHHWQLSDMRKFVGSFHEIARDLKLGMPLSELSEFHAGVMLDRMKQIDREAGG